MIASGGTFKFLRKNKQDTGILFAMVLVLLSVIWFIVHFVFSVLNEHNQICNLRLELEKVRNDADYLNSWKIKNVDYQDDSEAAKIFFQRSWCQFNDGDIEYMLKDIAAQFNDISELSLTRLKNDGEVFKVHKFALNLVIGSEANVYRFISGIENLLPGLVKLEYVDIQFDNSTKKITSKIIFSTINLGLYALENMNFPYGDVPEVCLFRISNNVQAKPLKLYSVIIVGKARRACVNNEWYSEGEIIASSDSKDDRQIKILSIKNDSVAIKFLTGNVSDDEPLTIKVGQVIPAE